MAAGKYSFTIEQGTTVDFELQYRDSSNIPIDLTGYTGAMSIRSTYSGSGTTYLALTSLTGSQYDDGKPSGSAFLSISGFDSISSIDGSLIPSTSSTSSSQSTGFNVNCNKMFVFYHEL